jgi:glucoamylase
VHIAALICAAEFFSDRRDHDSAEFVRDYADFLESHIERWTVTTQGTLVPGISRHYIRINPADTHQCADEDPDCGTLSLANQAPGTRHEFPAKEIVDAGFLELVRYGIRRADDPIIQDSLRVVDAVLKVETHMVRVGSATTMMVTASETIARPTAAGARDGHGHC